jgi:alpha-amylase
MLRDLSVVRLAAPLLVLTLASCATAPSSGRPPARPMAAAEEQVIQWDHEWARGAVFYEVFVRSFQDSNGDGIGDLQGLISRLDYLNDGDPATDSDLGVDALWLMPVFTSPSYHGYDVVDYESIEPDYGTGEDFQRLLDEAHRRGIRVIVDFVMNHSSAQHPWFIESASSPQSPYRDWYVWRADNPGWTQPWGGANRTWHEKNGAWYYGVFWGGMPDLNFQTPAVREEMKRVAALWLRRGLDGFRLDATRHLFANGPGDQQNDQPETHAFLKEFGDHVRGVAPQAMVVGENWTDTPSIARYYGSTERIKGGDELPMSFNFPLASAIVEGVNSGEGQPIAAKLEEMAELYPAGVLDAPFLTNHDMLRLATQLGKDPVKLRSAAAILLTLPGVPFLYYGEEVGLENGSADSRDELKRTPMPWDASTGGGFTTGRPWFAFSPGKEAANVAAQTGDAGSLLSWYRRLIRARKGSAALRAGSLELLTPTNQRAPVFAFVRASGGERVLVAHNLSDQEAEAGPFDLPGSAAEAILVSAGITAVPARGEGGWRVRLPAGGSGVWTLTPSP